MKKLTKLERFKKKVLSRYDVYNNVFLTLPFESINDTGKLLPVFSDHCLNGYNNKLSPFDIVSSFFEKYCKNFDEDEKNTVLFRFIQYIERQVVLFDAIEDASFRDIHNMYGIGTLRNLKEISEKANSSDELNTILSKLGLKTTTEEKKTKVKF